MSTEMFWAEQYKKVLHIDITMAWYFFVLFPDLKNISKFLCTGTPLRCIAIFSISRCFTPAKLIAYITMATVSQITDILHMTLSMLC